MEYRIFDLWPKVKKIEIEYKIIYPCSVTNETKVEQGTAIYKPDFLAEFHFDCINEECTGRGFDLYSIVSQMVAHNEVVWSGTMECKGMETRKYNHACPSFIDVTIRVDIIGVSSSE